MPAAAHHGQSQAIYPDNSSLLHFVSSAAPSPVTRRPTFEQGRALEILGHAIEYLVDSRLNLIDEPATRADSEATQLLMLRSRQVFTECTEVVPPIRRLKLWIAKRLTPSASC